MHWATLTLFISSIFFASLLLFDLRRRGLSYFFHIRNLFSLLFLLFIFLASSAIVFANYESAETAIVRAKTANVVAAMMSLIYGFLAASLSRYKGAKSGRELISKFWKEPYLPLIIYFCVIAAWILLTLLTTPFHAVQLTNILTGEVEYATIHETWYRILLSLVLVAVIVYPCLTLLRLSRLSSDKKMKRSFEIFATCMILFAISTPLLVFIRQYGCSEHELTYLLQTVLLAAMWYGFKKPTSLPRFLEMSEAFARRLGLRHNELVGKKILFEFDTASNYEAAVEDFVFESRANDEKIIVFTHRGSGLHLDLAKQTNLKLFYLTPQASVPTAGPSENEILLPSNDVSLMLDALNNTIKTNPGNNISIVFDNLSDLVLSVGFEKAYNFVRYALEMLMLGKVTTLFLLNSDAHDQEVTSSLRGLFSNQIIYGKDGIRAVK